MNNRRALSGLSGRKGLSMVFISFIERVNGRACDVWILDEFRGLLNCQCELKLLAWYTRSREK